MSANNEPVQIFRYLEFHALNLIVFTHSKKQSNDKHCENNTIEKEFCLLISIYIIWFTSLHVNARNIFFFCNPAWFSQFNENVFLHVNQAWA